MQKENISTPIYVEFKNMYRKRFLVKNSGISCLASTFDLSNPKYTWYLTLAFQK